MDKTIAGLEKLKTKNRKCCCKYTTKHRGEKRHAIFSGESKEVDILRSWWWDERGEKKQMAARSCLSLTRSYCYFTSEMGMLLYWLLSRNSLIDKFLMKHSEWKNILCVLPLKLCSTSGAGRKIFFCAEECTTGKQKVIRKYFDNKTLVRILALLQSGKCVLVSTPFLSVHTHTHTPQFSKCYKHTQTFWLY